MRTSSAAGPASASSRSTSWSCHCRSDVAARSSRPIASRGTLTNHTTSPDGVRCAPKNARRPKTKCQASSGRSAASGVARVMPPKLARPTYRASGAAGSTARRTSERTPSAPTTTSASSRSPSSSTTAPAAGVHRRDLRAVPHQHAAAGRLAGEHVGQRGPLERQGDGAVGQRTSEREVAEQPAGRGDHAVAPARDRVLAHRLQHAQDVQRGEPVRRHREVRPLVRVGRRPALEHHRLDADLLQRQRARRTGDPATHHQSSHRTTLSLRDPDISNNERMPR